MSRHEHRVGSTRRLCRQGLGVVGGNCAGLRDPPSFACAGCIHGDICPTLPRGTHQVFDLMSWSNVPFRHSTVGAAYQFSNGVHICPEASESDRGGYKSPINGLAFSQTDSYCHACALTVIDINSLPWEHDTLVSCGVVTCPDKLESEPFASGRVYRARTCLFRDLTPVSASTPRADQILWILNAQALPKHDDWVADWVSRPGADRYKFIFVLDILTGRHGVLRYEDGRSHCGSGIPRMIAKEVMMR